MKARVRKRREKWRGYCPRCFLPFPANTQVAAFVALTQHIERRHQ